MDQILSVTPNGNQRFRFEIVKDGKNNSISFVTADGELRGWGNDFVVFDKGGSIRTVDARGRVISIRHNCYNPKTEQFGGVGGNQFTIITRSRAVKVFDKKCNRIK